MFPFESDKEDKPWFIAFAVIAAIEVIVLFAVSWTTAGAHFMLPLDDSYIHLQYARMAASGSPLVYTTGMDPSGGMTSPLYVATLVPALLVGLNGAKGAFIAFLFGAVLWMLLPVWVYQLTKRLSNCLCGAIAAGLVLANGHLLWNFLSGMETALYTTLLVVALLGAQVWWHVEKIYGKTLLLLALAMLPLCRPEGAFLFPALIAVVLRRRGEHPRLGLPIIIACALPFIAWLAILYMATGDWRPAGLVTKGLSSHPYMTTSDKFAHAADTIVAISTRFYFNVIPDPAYAAFKGTTTLPYIPAGLVFLALFGATMQLVAEWRSGRPAGGSLLALAWILGLLSLAASFLPFIHQQRYLAPYTVLAIILAALGMRRIGQLFHQLEDTAIKAIGLGLLILSLPSVPFWMAEYGRNSRDIYSVLRVASFPLAGETRPTGITDAGVLAYYTNMPVYDFVGLGSREFTRATNHGEAATLEVLGNIPQQRRPATLVSYPNWWSENFPLGDPIFSVSVPRTSITSGTTIQQRPIEWEKIDLGDVAPMGRTDNILLEIDVADLASESEAGISYTRDIYDYDVRAWPQPLAPVAEFIRPAILADDPATTGTLIVQAGGPAVDGGRVVRSASFPFAPRERPPAGTKLVLRAGQPLHSGAPAPPADALTVSLVSNTTGFPARAEVQLTPGVPVDDIYIDLARLIDDAGGTAWTVKLESNPPGAALSLYHVWIVSD